MRRKFYLGTNLKMTKSISETVSFTQGVEQFLSQNAEKELSCFVCPSFLALPEIACTGPRRLILGAQNMCWAEYGEHTGEISPCMLQELAVQLVVLGHSERRRLYKEDYEMIRLKVESAVKHNIIALLCVGETSEEKENGRAKTILRQQLLSGVSNVSIDQIPNLWVAYEPMWAIGVSGKPAPARYVDSIHTYLRDVLTERFGSKGNEIPLLFGGSVNLENASSYVRLDHVDGMFVGRAVWTVEGFSKMVNLIQRSLQ